MLVLANEQATCSPHVAFEVRLQRERVAGESGPYREFFDDVCRELQQHALATGDSGATRDDGGAPPLLLPTPNHVSKWGDGRELFLLNPRAVDDDAMRMLRVVGRLIGCALRTSVNVPLALAPLVWKAVVGEVPTLDDLAAVDTFVVTNVIKRLQQCSEEVRVRIAAVCARNGCRRCSWRSLLVLPRMPVTAGV